MAHRQRAEEEAPVELVVGRLDEGGQLGDELVDLGDGRVASGQHGAQPVQREKVVAAPLVGRVALDGLSHPVVTREGRGEHDAGVVAHRLGQAPAVGQLGAEGRRLVTQHERDACVTERVEPGADREASGVVQRLVTAGFDAELLDDVDRGVLAGELDDLGGVVDRLERAAATRVLDEPRDPHVGHPLADLGCQ